MKPLRVLVPGALLLAMAAPAFAQETGHTRVMDENGQVVDVTSEEADSVVGDYDIDFAELDRDNDGFISREEAKANPTLSAEFDALDTGQRGRLDRAQLEGWMH